MAHHKDAQDGGGAGEGGGGSSGSISAAAYLVLLGDVLLVILLHLPELGLQPTQLDLHLLHVLQVPLGPLVQHLNGLGHVLDLRRWTEASDGSTKGVSDIQSRGFKKHPAAVRCVAHNSPRRPVGGLDTWRERGTQTAKTFVFPPGPLRSTNATKLAPPLFMSSLGGGGFNCQSA